MLSLLLYSLFSTSNNNPLLNLPVLWSFIPAPLPLHHLVLIFRNTSAQAAGQVFFLSKIPSLLRFALQSPIAIVSHSRPYCVSLVVATSHLLGGECVTDAVVVCWRLRLFGRAASPESNTSRDHMNITDRART